MCNMIVDGGHHMLIGSGISSFITCTVAFVIELNV